MTQLTFERSGLETRRSNLEPLLGKEATSMELVDKL